MKFTKNYIRMLGVVVVAISTAAIALSTSASDNITDSNAVSEKALLQIGKVSITSKDLAKYKAYKEEQRRINHSVNVDTSDSALLKELAVEKLEQQKAAELKASATLEEGKAEAEKMREFLKTQPAEVQQFQKELIQAMGYTEEKYWTQIAPEQYQTLLTATNLYAKLVELKEIPDDIQNYGANILNYQNKLFNDAKSNGSLTILDPSVTLK